MSLSGKQFSAVLVLARGGSLNEAAIASNVSVKTISRWQDIVEFQAEIDKLRNCVYDQAIAKLTDSAVGAIATLEEISKDYEAPAGARVSAARGILDLVMRDRSNDLNQALNLVRRYGYLVQDGYQEQNDNGEIDSTGCSQDLENAHGSQRLREGDRPD
jgi:hypothetical protein